MSRRCNKHRNRANPASRNAPLRITAIEAFEFHRVLDGTAWNPATRWHERRAPILRLTAEDGTMGLGEGWSDQQHIAAFFAQARSVASALLAGQAPQSSRSWPEAAVCSAVDIATADIRARQAGLPLHRLLAPMPAPIPVYASGGLYCAGQTPDALATEMAEYAARGFRTVKMKVGALPLDQDLARVAAVRAAIGPHTTIMVDAVGQLTRATMHAWAAALARLGVGAIQAPLPPDDLAGMAELQAAGPLTVIAGEAEHRPEALHALLDHPAVGMLQFNPGLAGGISGAQALITRAAAVPTTLQCFSTAILQAACFHLAAAHPTVASVEYHCFHDNLYAALPPAMTTLHQGHLHLDDRPGLGIDPRLPDTWPGPGTFTPIFRLT